MNIKLAKKAVNSLDNSILIKPEDLNINETYVSLSEAMEMNVMEVSFKFNGELLKEMCEIRYSTFERHIYEEVKEHFGKLDSDTDWSNLYELREVVENSLGVEVANLVNSMPVIVVDSIDIDKDCELYGLNGSALQNEMLAMLDVLIDSYYEFGMIIIKDLKLAESCNLLGYSLMADEDNNMIAYNFI